MYAIVTRKDLYDIDVDVLALYPDKVIFYVDDPPSIYVLI